ncbi:cytochrome b/b6 domain-containing protein [Bdellovibrio bacteriovorus]
MKNPERIYVWDIFVRVFHWTLVICVFLNFWVTEEGDTPHEVLGYIAAGFVIARLFWGFFGSPFARFNIWLASPKSVFSYLRNFKTRKTYQSHNPIAGWMIIFLMSCIIGLAVTGFMMGTDTYFGEEWVEELHHWISDILMGAVAIHIIGALYESRHEKQNLVAGMVHGYKNKVD